MSTDPQSDPHYVLQELENAKQVYGGGNYAAAEPLLREVFEKLQAHPEGMAFCAESLSEIYTAWGKFSEAIKLNQRFINLTAPQPNHNVTAIGLALERIAAVSLKVGKQEQSEKLNRLAASVKAGKVDVTTLVTDKGKIPNAPPTTEHTYTFRALSPDSPPPPQPSAPVAASSDVLSKPIKETAMFSKPNLPAQSDIAAATPPAVAPAAPQPAVPTAPTVSSVLPSAQPTSGLPPAPQAPAPTPTPTPTPTVPTPAAPFSSPQMPAAQPGPASPQPAGTPLAAYTPPTAPPAPSAGTTPSADVLSKPIKETAMFSRPSLPAQTAIPAVAAGQMGDVADFADFDEEIPVDSTSTSGSHPAVSQTSAVFQAPEVPPLSSPSPVTPPQTVPAPIAAPPSVQEPSVESAGDDWSQMESDDWGQPQEPEADGWGAAEPADHQEFGQQEQFNSPSQPQVQSQPVAFSPQPPALSGPHSPQFQAPQPSSSEPSFPAPEPHFSPESAAAPASFEAPAADLSTASGSGNFDAQFDPAELNAIDSQRASSATNAASSARSIRSMSSRNMAAPPVASGPDMGGLMGMIASMFVGKRDPDQPVQQLVDPSTTSANAAGALLVVAAIFIGGFYCLYNFIPRKLTPEQAYLAIQHKYVSVDSSKTFNLLDESTCEFTVGENKLKARLKFYLDDWRDALDLSLGKAGQKQFLMIKSDDGLVDENEARLYLHGGPEIQIANKLDIVGQYAGLVFTRTKKYPTSGDLMGGAADLHYLNPYSKKREVPSFHSIVVGKGLTVSLDADHARTKFYDDLLAGQIPKDTPKAHPGEIRCYAVDFLSPRGNIQAFIVQIIGKDGKPVGSAKARTAYLYALEDGKEYKPIGPAQLPYNGEQGLRPIVVWLLMDKLDSNFVLLLTMAPVVVFTILSFVFLVLSFLIPRGLGRAVAVMLLAACAIPALTFCFAKFLP